MEHMAYRDLRDLSPTSRSFPEKDRAKLSRFLSGLRVVTIHTGGTIARSIKKVSEKSAQQQTFKERDKKDSVTIAVCNTFTLPGWT